MLRRTAIAAAALALALPAGAHGAPAVNGIFDVSDTPSKLTRGPDGNVWVVIGGNTLARFTQAGAKQEFPLTGVNGAKGITSGPDGNLWLTASNAIVRVPVPPSGPTDRTIFTVNDVITPQAIVVGPDNNLWTASNDKVLRITTASPTTATLFTLTGTASPSARGIASSGGLLWVVDFGGAITSLTTAGVQTHYAVGGGPQDVGGSPSGQVLYSNPGNVPQQIGRIMPGGLPQKIDRPLTDPFGITFGADGAWWVADFASGDLARVTSDGAVTTLGGLPTNDPREITAGSSNTLWVALELSKKVARITGVDPPALPVTPPPVTPPVPVPPPAPVAAADTAAPAISALSVVPRRFRRGTAPLTRTTATAPARVSLTLGEAATVSFSADRLRPGRRVGGRCAAPRRANRRAPACRRSTPAGGAVALALPAGASSLGFGGRLVRSLAPGDYRLVAIASDAAGNRSAARRAAFTLQVPRR